MSDQLIVHIDGKVFTFWTKATIARSIERGAYSFELTLTDSFEQDVSKTKNPARTIKEGMSVSVFINDEQILTGYIDDVNPSYNKTSHSLSVTGRSKIADLIDCSTVGKQFKSGQTFLQIAKGLCADFDINIIVDDSAKVAANEPFKANHMLDVGQTIWDFLEGLARIKAVLLISNSAGDLVITRAGTKLADVALVLGQNIEAASGTFSDRAVFSEYTVCSQQANSPVLILDSVANTQPKATVANAGIRHRPFVISSDNPADIATCKTRAEWQKNVSEGRSQSVVYTVTGWRQKPNGELWTPNQLVAVDDSWMGWNDQRLIVEARIILDSESGSSTEVMVMPKGAFDLVPESEKAAAGFIL